MKKILKNIWSILLLLLSSGVIFWVYDDNKPIEILDQDESMIICDNGKRFTINEYGPNASRELDYECSDFFGKISFEQFKNNFGENYEYMSRSGVKCINKDLGFRSDAYPDSIDSSYRNRYFMYKCSEYSSILSFTEYNENINNYKKDYKLKKVEGHTKQIIYIVLSTILLALFWYLITFKEFGKLPIYFKLLIIIGDIAAICLVFFLLLILMIASVGK